MSRLRRIEDHDRIFFVTTNIARAQSPLNEAERDIVVEAISEVRKRGGFFLFAYVIMPDHMHLLIAPRAIGLIGTVRDMKRLSAYRILAKRTRADGALWQPRYFDNIIRRVRDFWGKLEYIRQNPVEAGLVKNASDWKWSSYARYTHKRVEAPPKAPAAPVDLVDLPTDGNALLWPAPWG